MSFMSNDTAKVDDVIRFSAYRDEPDGERIGDFVNFRIRYNDILGNLYEQEFKFGYDNYIENGFNKNKRSYPAKIVSLAKLDYKEEEEDEFDRYF